MELVTLDEFIAEIETTFSNYAATGDIDRNSIKTWVITELRKFGKNICTKNETIVEIKNSKAVLPETFRSMILGLKLTNEGSIKKTPEKRLIVEKQKIENPAYWSNATMDYYVDFCQSKITTEKIYTNYEYEDKWYNYQWLSLVEGMNKDTIAVDCLNMNPAIRNNYPDKISITGRTLTANFKDGKIYLQYNSLPTVEEEIAIPVFSTGDILKHIKNAVKLELAETLDINEKNAQSLMRWVGIWKQDQRRLFLEAMSESNWKGIDQEKFAKQIYKKNRQNQNRYNLPS